MKHWYIASGNVKDAKRIAKAEEEDKRKVGEVIKTMNLQAEALRAMVDHLSVQVECGLISEEERETILRGMKTISDVYASQKKEDVKERINERGAKRIAEKLGLEAHCVEVGDGE